MRVVAGEYKGRRLAGPKGGVTRPTSDKVREALFSIIGPVDGLRVLDLFAGTGALGVEALSRGAGQCTFVERDKRMRAVLRTNLNVTAGDPGAARARAVGSDALDFLRRAAGRQEFDLVLIDPPYAEAARLSEPLSSALPPVLAPGATIVVECDRRTPLDLTASAQDGLQNTFALHSERRYGDTLLTVLKAWAVS
ncbi:MAG: 16S rRNA (guanine(966)-N(2))-methyltransferase RsmD [Actinobacteria bacterium]|nr:16S rRNA (guanine(966)-N(2))-methyltransferase RsmD [Actinomycetota bacterium]